MISVAVALPFDFEQPAWLWLWLLIPVLVVASLRSLAGLDDPVRRVLALVTRGVVIMLVAACLAGVQWVRRSDDLTVIFLMDRSYSVEAAESDAETFIRESTKSVRPDDRVGVIDFARNAFVQQMPITGGYQVQPGRLPAMPNDERTSVASAIRLAMAMFPHDTNKRIVLMSDGNDNMSDVLSEVRRAKADGIGIDVVPLTYEHRNEVYFERMIAPTYAEPGEQVPVRMVAHTQKPVSGTVSVYLNGELFELPEEAARINLSPGSNTFFMKLPITGRGAQTYEVVFRPDNDSMDTIALNNTASAFSFVTGTSRVLLLTPDPKTDQALADALRSENVELDVRTPADLEQFDLLHMMTYSSIILANTPAAIFTQQQQEELATYVRDMGSGLIMTGGDEGFGAGGWIGSPVEAVMPVTFEVKHKRVIPRGALVLIMHSCEIPRGNYWGKEMAKKSVDTISSQDYIGVLAYTFSPGGENWEVPLGLNTNKAAVKAKIDRMQIGDMPDFGTTMRLALKELTGGIGRDAAQKHVIILSDGDAQGPSRGLIRDYQRAQITVSTIAIGWGGHVMAREMRNIARQTNGKYYAARNPRQLPLIFTKESKVVRRPLIVDDPFQPQVLQAQSELLAGINPFAEALPPLGGMVLASAKENPNVIVPLARMTDDGEDPVLAHWQCELGKAVAFTSGWWPVWGENWTSWPKFAKFWAQLVRWTMRQETPANFDTYTKIEGSRGRIVIDALDKNADYLNYLQQQAKVVGPGNEVMPLQFTQTGPGKYEAEFDAEKAGQYLANVQIFDQGRQVGTLRTGLSVPFSPEYRDLTPNTALLRKVTELTDGRWCDAGPKAADVMRHDLDPVEAKRPAWEWVLAWMLLPAFLLDVAVRRLASWLALSVAVELVVLCVLLFGIGLVYGPWWGIAGAFLLAELIGWIMRFRYIGPLFDFLTHTVTALGQTGERSAASLDQLKSTRDRVRDGLGEGAVEGVRRVAEQHDARDRAVAKRRYDVGDQQGAQPAGDLVDALGGAKATDRDGGKPPGKPQDAADSTEDEATTSRLLKAKRRARRKDDE